MCQSTTKALFALFLPFFFPGISITSESAVIRDPFELLMSNLEDFAELLLIDTLELFSFTQKI